MRLTVNDLRVAAAALRVWPQGDDSWSKDGKLCPANAIAVSQGYKRYGEHIRPDDEISPHCLILGDLDALAREANKSLRGSIHYYLENDVSTLTSFLQTIIHCAELTENASLKEFCEAELVEV